MAKSKELGLDKSGVQMTMHTKDYLADAGGQLGINLAANLVGQMTYFYTDKAGVAVAGLGIVMLISKLVDALTDVWFGNIIDHSKGGNKKFYLWVKRMMIPFALSIILLFTVPTQYGSTVALIYVLISNIFFSSVCMTMLGTPLGAIIVVRTNSQEERAKMGIFRAGFAYLSGMIAAIATIPVTNMLGGDQAAWLKYATGISVVSLIMLLICYLNGRNAVFADGSVGGAETEEEAVPLKESLRALFSNKYWVIVLLFNLITQVTNFLSTSSGTYYTKWIFGNDNLVATMGTGGMLATLAGFVLSNKIISKLGVKRTIQMSTMASAIAIAIRSFLPTHFNLFFATSFISSFVQIPMMCLYGVLLSMAVDYNEYKTGKKMVSVASGAIGIGTKVGGGLASIVISACLALGAYDASLAEATTSMRYAIYSMCNYIPIVINVVVFLLISRFDLEDKLPAIQAELAERRQKSL